MEPRYPIFILTDEKSVISVPSRDVIGGYVEPNDIDTGEFSGWDAEGRPLRLFHVQYKESCAELSGEPAQPEKLREAVRYYAEHFAEGFSLPECFDEADIAPVLAAIDTHIRENRPPGLVERAKRWIFGV